MKNLHEIQLVDLKIPELFIKENDNIKGMVQDEIDFSLRVSHSSFDEQSRTIYVRVQCLIGVEEDEENSNLPFSCRVSVEGRFEVEKSFPDQHVYDWASSNAPLVLYPYIRENVYSLAAKIGYNGMVLPLLSVPAFKM